MQRQRDLVYFNAKMCFQLNVVSQWDTPKDEMVTYRSFRPFFPLMAVEQPSGVQMWAVWAVQQVCLKNRELSALLQTAPGAMSFSLYNWEHAEF